MLSEQERQRQAAAIDAAREQAALQAQRDAELASQQRGYAQQQAGLQSQLSAQQNEYERQRMLLSGGLQERRDYLGADIQQQRDILGADIQARQNVQQSGLRREEATHQVDLNARLSEVQLNQQEQMRLRRLQQAASHTDEQVQAGYLTPEEGAAHKMQIVTGINPLQNRALEAERIQTQLRSQGIEQQNNQQGVLFAQRQQRMAAGAAGNIQSVYNPDTDRMERYMVDVTTGELRPLESSSVEQARQAHLMETGQAIQQRGAMFPGQLRGQEAGIAATQAQTMATIAQTGRADALHPQQLQLLQQQVRQGPQAFQSEQEYVAARTALLQMQVEQTPQEFRSTQEYRQAQIALANAHGEQVRAQVAQMPEVMRMQQEVQQGNMTHQEFQNRSLAATTALTQLQVDGGMPSTVATHAIESIMRGIDADLANPTSAISGRIARLPAGEQAAAISQYRTERMSEGVRSFRDMFQQFSRPPQAGDAPMPGNLRSGAQATPPGAAPVPRLANVTGLLPEQGRQESGINRDRIRSLQRIASAVDDSMGDPVSRFMTNDSSLVTQMRDILGGAMSANRVLTRQEEANYLNLHSRLATANPELARMMNLTGDPVQEGFNAPISRLRLIQTELGNIISERRANATLPGITQNPIASTSVPFYSIRDLLNKAISENRPLTPAETIAYQKDLAAIDRYNPEFTRRLQLHRE